MLHHIKQVFQVGLMSSGIVWAFSLFNLPCQAQPLTQTTILEILDGDQVYIQDRKARINDEVLSGETIRTEQARVGLLFNAVNAGARLGQNSSLVVEGRCVRLNRGTVMITGSMKNNRGCLGAVVVTNRGTVYLMEREDNGLGRITVLDNSVEVSNPSRPDIQPVALVAGQSVEINSFGEIGSPFQVTSTRLTQVASPLLEGFQQALPDLAKLTPTRQPSGFTNSFLQEALGNSDSFAQNSDLLKGTQPIEFVGSSLPGIFVRTGRTTGSFTPSGGGPAIPISVDFGNRSISIGGLAGTSSSLGLSGRNASGTIVLQNPQTIPGTALTGQVIRIQVFGVELQEPKFNPPIPYPGSLSIGSIRDR